MTFKTDYDEKKEIPYKQQLEQEIQDIKPKIETLFEWLRNNPLAGNFDVTYNKFLILTYRKEAKQDALNRINYPAIHRRQNAMYLPLHALLVRKEFPLAPTFFEEVITRTMCGYLF